MARKLNCWQFQNCGREKGGLLAERLGQCPVSTAMEFDGLNDGIGAGRACWMVPQAVCHKDAARLARMGQCYSCEFYYRVIFEQEENARFTFASTGA